jgi:flagellar M-ring protein FliF
LHVEITTLEDQEAGWRRDWKSFGSPQFAAFGLLAVAVLILGFWFMRWSTAPTWSMAASGLTATEAADARAELDGAGIENRLANGGSGIEVPSAATAEAAVVLGDAGVIGGAAEGYEILDRQGFTTSSFKQRIDFQRAIEGELAQTISAMDAVSSATVHLAIPEESVFSDNDGMTRASVVVSGAPDQGTVASIVSIVASAVPDLDPSSVTVADTSGRILSSLDGSGMVSDQQLGMQQLLESQLEMDAQTMLAQTLGSGAAVVRVSADINFDEVEREEVIYTPQVDADGAITQLPLRQQLSSEAYTGDAAAAGGPLGVIDDFNDAGQLIEDDGAGAYVRSDDTTEFGVPSTRIVSREAPGAIERLSVAVMIDANLDPAPDPAAIQALVAAAVGLDQDGRGDVIEVVPLEFDQTAAEEAEALAAAITPTGPSMIDTVLGYLRTAVAIIGIILALLFLRKGLKPLLGEKREAVELEPGAAAALTAGAANDATTLIPVVDAEIPANADAALTAAAGSSPLEAGPEAASTVDMLQLIDQQPDEVADLLRGWMAEAK